MDQPDAGSVEVGRVHVRPATASDLAAVDGIICAAFRPFIARIGCKPAPMLQDYGALIGAGFVHVVAIAGQVQGVLVLVPRQEAMLLDTIAVAPRMQGQGIGRHILEFAEQAALAAGYSIITLYTHEAMVENIALYKRCAYVETHRVEESGFRRVYMRKALSKNPDPP